MGRLDVSQRFWDDLLMTGVVRQHTLEELFERARAQIERHEPIAAHAAVRAGAVLIDIRAGDDRARDGIIPGSLHIPRTVLEWRTNPRRLETA